MSYRHTDRPCCDELWVLLEPSRPLQLRCSALNSKGEPNQVQKKSLEKLARSRKWPFQITQMDSNPTHIGLCWPPIVTVCSREQEAGDPLLHFVHHLQGSNRRSKSRPLSMTPGTVEPRVGLTARSATAPKNAVGEESSLLCGRKGPRQGGAFPVPSHWTTMLDSGTSVPRTCPPRSKTNPSKAFRLGHRRTLAGEHQPGFIKGTWGKLMLSWGGISWGPSLQGLRLAGRQPTCPLQMQSHP